MSFFRAILFFTLFLVSSSLYSHNPEDFVIADIERGQMNFENEQIAAEYGAALKRQRAGRLAAMPFYKKFYIWNSDTCFFSFKCPVRLVVWRGRLASYYS